MVTGNSVEKFPLHRLFTGDMNGRKREGGEIKYHVGVRKNNTDFEEKRSRVFWRLHNLYAAALSCLRTLATNLYLRFTYLKKYS
jgi:hypothetical protein